VIHSYPDRCLRGRAREVVPGSPNAREAAARLRAAFGQVEGLGLAAPQVGLPYRVVLAVIGEETLVLLNPEIVERSSEVVVDSEACLSLPGVSAPVARPERVCVTAVDEDGRPRRFELEGWEARLLAHEMDHLEGILYFDHLPAEERRRVIREYKALGRAVPSAQ